jgi:hypothetical protein
MTLPGCNLLGMALRVIGQQTFQYYAFVSRATNDIGIDVPTYAAPVPLTGSVQPVPRNLYQVYGLQLDKYYATFFVSQNVLDVTRDVSGDQIGFNGQTFQVEQKTDWFAQDGWDSFLAVKIT